MKGEKKEYFILYLFLISPKRKMEKHIERARVRAKAILKSLKGKEERNTDHC